ncbi:MAG TPA: LacI family DNA-binding transcriptional regulator [Opitutaceae bacterium]|nr:LacI family DNA-binding transcriptional regulator [Opitutaceae bacterium]
MNRRVTQQDIADQLGMDKSTVSLALRDNPAITPATRKRVHAMAEKLGYRPDPALAALARQRWAGHETGSGAVLAYLIDSRMKNASQHLDFLPAARHRAEARGYQLRVFDLAEHPSVKAFSRILYHRGIRGLLVPQFAHTAGPGILELPVDNLTIVCLELGWVPMPFHIVAPDDFEATRRAWHEAIKRGYDRIGGAVLFHTPPAVNDASRYGSAASIQLEQFTVRQRVPLLTSGPKDRDRFVRWLERYEPKVVIGFVSTLQDWIRSTGRRVPEDVAFVSLGVSVAKTPEVSGILRQLDSIGTVGVDALIAAMRENEWGVPTLQRKLLIEPVWHEGSTLPRRIEA